MPEASFSPTRSRRGLKIADELADAHRDIPRVPGTPPVDREWCQWVEYPHGLQRVGEDTIDGVAIERRGRAS